MTLKAVVFDIDGTLYPQTSIYLRSAPTYIKNWKFVRAYSKVRKLLRHREFSPELRQDIRRMQANIIAENEGWDPDKTFATTEQLIYKDWVESFAKIKLFPAVYEVFAEIKKRRLLLGVMSDFPIEEKLDFFGIRDYLDTATCSEDSGYLKPDPRPFRAVAESLGIKINEMLYVGNNYKYDVLGARNAGCPVAHITPIPHIASKALFSFAKFSQFMLYFDRYIS